MCKNVYIYSWAIVTVYIYTVTIVCIFIILLIFVRTNFSLSSPCTTISTPHLLFLRCTQTHPHRQINTETHPHTNKPTQTNQQRNRSMLVEFGSWIGRWRKDMGHRSLVHGLAGEERIRIWVVELGLWIGWWRKDMGRRSLVCGRRSLVHGSAGEERIWVAGAWFVDRLVKKGSGSPKLGLWIGRWRKDLGRGAWFVDQPVKKGSGSTGEERTWWRSDLGW